jgi:amino acid transporter
VAFLEGGVVEGIAIQLNPNWIPKQWQGTLIAWAVILPPLLCNVFARKILVKLELVAGVANILFFFVIVIVLGAMAPRSPASFVFSTTFTGISGWKSAGVQWCIGLLSAAFPLQGFDGVIHMSAEIKDPARRVPQAMVLAVVLNGLFSFPFVIALLFTITDVNKAAASRTFYPIIEGMSIPSSEIT